MGLCYQLVSARRTLGPPWILLVLIIATLAVIRIAKYRGLRRVTRLLSLAVTTAITLAVAFSATLLVAQALERHMDHPGQVLARRIEQLSGELRLDRARIHDWGLMQAVLAVWWALEDHGTGWEPWIACANLLADL